MTQLTYTIMSWLSVHHLLEIFLHSLTNASILRSSLANRLSLLQYIVVHTVHQDFCAHTKFLTYASERPIRKEFVR